MVIQTRVLVATRDFARLTHLNKGIDDQLFAIGDFMLGFGIL